MTTILHDKWMFMGTDMGDSALPDSVLVIERNGL